MPGAVAVMQNDNPVAIWKSHAGVLQFRFHDDRYSSYVADAIDDAVNFTGELVQDARPDGALDSADRSENIQGIQAR